MLTVNTLLVMEDHYVALRIVLVVLILSDMQEVPELSPDLVRHESKDHYAQEESSPIYHESTRPWV